MTNDIEIVERLTRVEAQTTNNTTDIAELKEDTKAISKIANGIEIMAVEMKGMSENINRIDNKVSGLTTKVTELEQLPTKAKASILDKVVISIASAVGGGLLMWILSSLLPTIFK